jgi:hypothetical protein
VQNIGIKNTGILKEELFGLVVGKMWESSKVIN